MSTKLLSRHTDYAVRALCYLADYPGQVVAAEEMVRRLEMPRPFLRQILQKLNKAGIVASQKGAGGGFCLAKPPESIGLVDLIEIFQGPLKLNECLFRKKVCPNRQKCLLRDKLLELEAQVVAGLREITIASLVGEKEKT